MPENVARPGKRAYTTSLSAEERSEQARQAALTRWAHTADREAAMRAAREARNRQWYAEADAQGVVDPVLREKMAAAAQRAHMSRMRKIQLTAARQAREAAAQAGEAS